MLLIFALACGEEEKPVQLTPTDSTSTYTPPTPNTKESNDCFDSDAEYCFDCLIEVYLDELLSYQQIILYPSGECACTSYCQDICSEQDCQKASDGRLIEVEFECFDCTLRYSSIDSFCYNEYIDACMDNASCSLFSEKYAQCVDLIEEEETDTSE